MLKELKSSRFYEKDDDDVGDRVQKYIKPEKQRIKYKERYQVAVEN